MRLVIGLVLLLLSAAGLLQVAGLRSAGELIVLTAIALFWILLPALFLTAVAWSYVYPLRGTRGIEPPSRHSGPPTSKHAHRASDRAGND